MAGRDGSKGAVAYELEASWAENVAFSAPIRVPQLDRVNIAAVKRGKIEPANVTQLLNEGVLYIPGPYDAVTFELIFYVAGHGGVTSGAVAATILPTLIKNVIGYAPAPITGTTITAGWTTTGGTIGSALFPAGWIAFIGALRDGRAGGNPGLLTSNLVTAATLANALPAAPNNTDLFHSSEMVHLPSSPADAQMAITSTRWLLQTADQCLAVRGCFPTGFAIESLGTGDVARIRIPMQGSYFEPSTATFPTALATDNFVPAVNAGGMAHVQVKGTTTRALVDYRLMSMEVGLGITPVRGPGGVFDGQTIVGARRVPAPILYNFAEDAPSATLTPTRLTQWDAEQYYTIVGATNLRPGKRFGYASPNCCFTDLTIQDIENGLNVTRFQLRAHDDPAGIGELGKSAWRGAFA